jgi:hypothetical protein
MDKKYRVPFKASVVVYVEVEAENEKEAWEKAWEDAHISSYCGNGGCDKLVGVSGHNCSIDAGEELEEFNELFNEINKD